MDARKRFKTPEAVMTVYPNIPHKQAGYAADPSAGDTVPASTVNNGANGAVTVVPEAANATIKKSPSALSTHSKLPIATATGHPNPQRRRQAERTNIIKSLCVAILLVCGISLLGLIVIEGVNHLRLLERANMWFPRFYHKYVWEPDSFHVHKDAKGNKYRNTLASANHCIHKRLGEVNNEDFEVVHDTRSRWSAVVQHNRSRCLLFYMTHQEPVCPKQYPWGADEQMGALGSQTALQGSVLTRSVRKITRLIGRYPIMDISCAGRAIADACKDYSSYNVLSVTVSYIHIARNERSANQDRVTKRPHGKLIKNLKKARAKNRPVYDDTFTLSLYQIPETPLVKRGSPLVREVLTLLPDSNGMMGQLDDHITKVVNPKSLSNLAGDTLQSHNSLSPSVEAKKKNKRSAHNIPGLNKKNSHIGGRLAPKKVQEEEKGQSPPLHNRLSNSGKKKIDHDAISSKSQEVKLSQVSDDITVSSPKSKGAVTTRRASFPKRQRARRSKAKQIIGAGKEQLQTDGDISGLNNKRKDDSMSNVDENINGAKDRALNLQEVMMANRWL